MRAGHNSLHTNGSRRGGEAWGQTNRHGSPRGCGGPLWGCQPCLKELNMRHMALVSLHGAARLCAPEELAGINWGILSSCRSPPCASGRIGSRHGLSFAAPRRAPCSCWRVQLGSGPLGSHQPSPVLSNSHQEYWLQAHPLGAGTTCGRLAPEGSHWPNLAVSCSWSISPALK